MSNTDKHHWLNWNGESWEVLAGELVLYSGLDANAANTLCKQLDRAIWEYYDDQKTLSSPCRRYPANT